MTAFASKILPRIKKTLRQTDTEFDDEIGSYIDTCVTDLTDVGILPSFFDVSKEVNGQILQACRWYCLANFGLYNSDMEKYDKSYRSLKATLATQRKYTCKDYQ